MRVQATEDPGDRNSVRIIQARGPHGIDAYGCMAQRVATFVVIADDRTGVELPYTQAPRRRRSALRYIKRLTGSRHSRVRSHCLPARRAHRSPTINFIHTRTHADTARQTAGHMEGQTGGTTNKDNSPSPGYLTIRT